MVNISRVRVALSMATGGPGVSTFYCLEPTAMTAALSAYYDNMRAWYPASVTTQVQNSGDVINPLDGELVGSWSDAAQPANVGAYTGGYSAPSGASVEWLTNTVLNGHRLRGRTFHVPLGNDAYQNDGTLTDIAKAALLNYGETFRSAMEANFVVWNRPITAAMVAKDPIRFPTTRAGGYSITSATRVSDKAAVLRSRRD